MTPSEIKPGTIRVSSVDQVVDDPNCKVWHIECNSKYVEILAYGPNDSHSIEVTLNRGEYTIRYDESTELPTSVVLRATEDMENWNVIANGGRYTVRVAAYNPIYPD